MRRLICMTALLGLLSGMGAAQANTSSKKSAAKPASSTSAAPAKTADAGSSHVKAYTPDQIKWGPAPNALPAGAQIAILEGDPMKAGPYTIRLKMPNGYKIPPHSHARNEHVTVLSGSVHVGMGDKFDEQAMNTFGAGSFAVIDAGQHHYAMAKNDMMFKGKDTVIQLHGEGPWEIKYVNAGDDPRNKK